MNSKTHLCLLVKGVQSSHVDGELMLSQNCRRTCTPNLTTTLRLPGTVAFTCVSPKDDPAMSARAPMTLRPSLLSFYPALIPRTPINAAPYPRLRLLNFSGYLLRLKLCFPH